MMAASISDDNDSFWTAASYFRSGPTAASVSNGFWTGSLRPGHGGVVVLHTLWTQKQRGPIWYGTYVMLQFSLRFDQNRLHLLYKTTLLCCLLTYPLLPNASKCNAILASMLLYTSWWMRQDGSFLACRWSCVQPPYVLRRKGYLLICVGVKHCLYSRIYNL